ncbi:acetate/propionate family kinase [Altericroceibacterium spongiae]|uniref:Acetate kinase n=1 Tax=Altericroceibacterium spongiae TaxID=2320269 RepID=A0A420ECL9_9SPHN|nr:acetate/propionate family kinase [Altericroceibacterium spongiae]RKF18394.1 acetate/propionate family kinase [Altericroceibacterium spongiae]
MKAIVSLNSGSSSIKFSLFAIPTSGEPKLSAGGKIEKIGIAPQLRAIDIDGTVLIEKEWRDGATLTHADLLQYLFTWARDHPLQDREIIAIGHRVVHGGTQFARPRIVNEALLKELEKLCPLAPLHQPHNLAAIKAIAKLAPNLPQIACFDTEFHHDKPEIASRLALPRAMHDQGIRRYGFHGLSYEYIARRLQQIDPDVASGKVIAAHLGNGASLCAMQDGKSIDTTMGFTALDGLMMGTRCGSLDPGVVIHFIKEMGMDIASIEDLLYRQSGLLGVSGISSDMRVLSDKSSQEACEAIDLFCWRAAREAGALISSLGGIDGFVFTAGIGENASNIRAMIGERLRWVGIEIDAQANAANQTIISTTSSPVTVMIIPTDEEHMIALHTVNLLRETRQ